jgi:hypothetical protein
MVSTSEKSQPGAAQAQTAAALSDILVESLQLVARAGHADAACRLAGRACAALRHDHPTQWRRFNVLLHRLSPATGKISASEVPERLLPLHNCDR